MTRYTLDLGDDMNKRLAEMVEKKGAGSKAEILRRAFITYEALTKEAEQGNRSVAISDEKGDVVRQVILP